MTDFAPIDLTTTRLSYFLSLYRPEETRVVTLSDVIGEIPDPQHKARTEGLRNLLSQSGEDAYTAKKKMLPGVTLAGTFTHREIAGFKESNGLLVQEIDFKPKIPDLPRCEELKARFVSDPFIVLVWTSPSATGLRLIFRIPQVASDDAYKALWSQVSDYIEQTYEITTDKACKDISRLLFVSHDPAIYLNLSAAPFPGYRGARELIRARAELESMVDGERYLVRNKLGYTLGGHITGGSLEESHVVCVVNPVIERTTIHPDKSLKNFWKAIQDGQAKPIKPDSDGEQPPLDVQVAPEVKLFNSPSHDEEEPPWLGEDEPPPWLDDNASHPDDEQAKPQRPTGALPLRIKLSYLTCNHGFKPRARPPYRVHIPQSVGDLFGVFVFAYTATWGSLA